MTVLVDTSIWSLALRRQPRHLSLLQQSLVNEWRRLVSSGEAYLAGLIRQELLSGIRDHDGFRAIQTRLDFFDHLETAIDDYDQAAVFSNTLQSNGLAAAPVDSLLCAIAYRWGLAIFTTDRDFDRFAALLPIQLHRPR